MDNVVFVTKLKHFLCVTQNDDDGDGNDGNDDDEKESRSETADGG